MQRIWLSALFLAASLFLAAPREAAAIDLNDVDVEGRSYLMLVSFADFFNGDCFKFEEDNFFQASYGLIVGEWSYESETFALLFTVNYVEVDVLSASEATITCITALNDRVIVGMIETNDGDGGFFFGVESDICEFPAREPESKPIQPVPDNSVPRRDRGRQ